MRPSTIADPAGPAPSKHDGDRASARTGQDVVRVEHRRLITGEGEFVSDIPEADCLHLVVVRSTIASGRIASLTKEDALGVPGVVAVFSADDFEGAPPVIPMRIIPVPAMQGCLQPALARERVRYVGEPVAIVVATSVAAGEDGVEAVGVEYVDEDPKLGWASGGHPVWSGLDRDEFCKFNGRTGDVESAFARADVVVGADFRVGRHTAMPLEPRGVLAKWDGRDLDLWGPAKYLKFTRQVVADSLGLEVDHVRCHHVDVGGGFGARGEVYPEDLLVPWAAMKLNRSVRWVEDRREHFLAINHSREHAGRFEIAADANGRLLAFRFSDQLDMGAYSRPVGGRMVMLAVEASPGPYVWDAYESECTGFATNKTPVGTMRGPSGYEVNFMRERAIDMVAHQLDIDAAELRRLNLIPHDRMPYSVDLGGDMEAMVLDTGNYPEIFRSVLAEVGYEMLREEVEERRRAGELVGIGLGAFIDHSGLGKTETALVELDDQGTITLTTTGSEIGQGIASMMQAVVSPILNVPPQSLKVVSNDTTRHDQGNGTYASRSTVFVGSALVDGAQRLRAQVQESIGERLGCPAQLVELGPTGAVAKGVVVPWSDIGEIRVVGSHDAEEPTFGFGFHLAVATVDQVSGAVTVERLMIAYDCGRAIDREGVHGQLAGAAVQGLGGALLEELRYDDLGQPQTTTLADYMLPTATDVPEVEVYIVESAPVPTNPLGAKGAGEAGILGVGAAIANAAADALRAQHVELTSLPLRPDDVAEKLGWLDLPARPVEARPRRADDSRLATRWGAGPDPDRIKVLASMGVVSALATFVLYRRWRSSRP